MTFDPTDAPAGANGSFFSDTQTANVRGSQTIAINPSKRYYFSFKARQRVPGIESGFFGFLMPLDYLGYIVDPTNYMYIAGSTTTLTEDLNPDDMVIHLADASNWYGGATANQQRAIFWDYVDPGGHDWPVETYSRNDMPSGSWDAGAVDMDANTVTLNAAYSGPARSAGTPLSNGSSGGTYIYMPINVVVPEVWTEYSGTISGINHTGASPTFARGFSPGCVAVHIGFLMNRNVAGGSTAVSGISLITSTRDITVIVGSISGSWDGKIDGGAWTAHPATGSDWEAATPVGGWEPAEITG